MYTYSGLFGNRSSRSSLSLKSLIGLFRASSKRLRPLSSLEVPSVTRIKDWTSLCAHLLVDLEQRNCWKLFMSSLEAFKQWNLVLSALQVSLASMGINGIVDFQAQTIDHVPHLRWQGQESSHIIGSVVYATICCASNRFLLG